MEPLRSKSDDPAIRYFMCFGARFAPFFFDVDAWTQGHFYRNSGNGVVYRLFSFLCYKILNFLDYICLPQDQMAVRT